MAVAADPVGAGLVASLAQPGGNVTGLSLLAPEIVGKQLELLKEAVPGVSRVAVPWNSIHLLGAHQLREAKVAVRSLGVELYPIEAHSPDEFDSAFALNCNE